MEFLTAGAVRGIDSGGDCSNAGHQ